MNGSFRRAWAFILAAVLFFSITIDINAVDITSESSSDTTISDELTDEISPLNEDSETPEDDLLIKLSATGENGTVRLIQKSSEGTFTVDLEALVCDGEDKPVSGANIVWSAVYNAGENEAPEVTLSQTEQTSSETGKCNITASFAQSFAGYVEITAKISDSDVKGSIRFDIYDILPDDPDDRELNPYLHLPDEPEAQLKGRIVLPEDSSYSVAWKSEDEETVTVDETGKVTGLKRNIAEGTVVKEIIMCGEEPADERVFTGEVPDVTHLVKTDVELESFKITSLTEKFYSGNTRTMLCLVTSPAEFVFTPEELESIRWTSSYPDTLDIIKTEDPLTASLSLKSPGAAAVTAIVSIRSGEELKNVSDMMIIDVLETASSITVYNENDVAVTQLKALPETSFSLKSAAYDSKGRLIDKDSKIDCELYWTSDNEEIATVNGSGIVQTFKEGTVHITATDRLGEKSLSVTLNVVWEITDMIPDSQRITLKTGESAEIGISLLPAGIMEEKYALGASSDDENIASVTLTGKKIKINGTSDGSTVIRIFDEQSGTTVNVDVIVGGTYKPVTRITSTSDIISMYTGETKRLRYSVTPADYTDTMFVWESLHESVVTVDRYTGEVTAVKAAGPPATVVVYAMHDGETVKQARYQISVRQRPEVDFVTIVPGVTTITAPDKQLGIEAQTVYLNTHIFPENAMAQNMSWSTDDESIATVDPSTGLVTAVSPGTAQITVTVTGEGLKTVTQTAKVNVVLDIEDADKKTDSYKSGDVWIGAIPDRYYTGSQIKPEPNVYFGEIRLTPGKDYTCSYSNNIKAGISKNAPSVKVKLKGSYSGTLDKTFQIRRRPIGDAVIGNVSAAALTKNSQLTCQYPDPEIMFEGKRLKCGTDYELTYPDEAEGAYKDVTGNGSGWKIHVTGIGNFSGEADTYLYIADPSASDNISKKNVTLEYKTCLYTGEPVTPKVTCAPYVENEDFEVRYANNVNAGTATVFVTGKGAKCYGTKKLTFKINPNPISLEKADLTVKINGRTVAVTNGRGHTDLTYEKGGIKPEISVYDAEGTKLPVSSYSASVKTDLKNMSGQILIKGKGKEYKDTAVISFGVNRRSIRDLMPVIDDFVYSAKSGAYMKNRIRIYDRNGKLLKAGTDYVLSDFRAQSDIPPVGSVVTVNASGQGFYDGEAVLSFRVVSKDSGIGASKAYFLDDDIEIDQNAYYVRYSGQPAQVRARDIVIKMPALSGKTAVYNTIDPDKYEIVGFINNDKPGTATVFVHGLGNYSGIKEIKFKIKK